MLNIENIHVAINGIPILRGVSFKLEAGKTTTLIGRNGAGKTTTLRAFMGLLPMQSGSPTSRAGRQPEGLEPCPPPD